MPDNARPWPCYPTAHLLDKELSRCSWGAEGLLWRLCSLSATGHIFGYVTDSAGKPLTVTEITESKAPAVLRGKETAKSTEKYLAELLTEGRIAQDQKTRAYIVPKMVRIGEQRRIAAEWGQRGGNPRLTMGEEGTQERREITREDCQRAAEGIGLTPAQIEAFFVHYAAVDFVDGAGRPITNLKYALAKWKRRDAEVAPGPRKESDAGIIDYARQYRAMTHASVKVGDGGVADLLRKVRDAYGPDGVQRVKDAAKQITGKENEK